MEQRRLHSDTGVRNILPKLLPKRIHALLEHVEKECWTDGEEVAVFGGPVNDRFLSLEEGQRQEFAAVKKGECFGPPNAVHSRVPQWCQRWFRIDLPAAAAAEKGRRALHWDCRGETTVYIDGLPWAGLDVAHEYCVLPDEKTTLWLDCGAYQTAIWIDGKEPDEHGLRFDGARIKLRNEAAWDAYWDFEVLVRLMKDLTDREGYDLLKESRLVPDIHECDPVLRVLIDRLNQAAAAYQTEGIEGLGRELQQVYRDLPAEYWQLKATAIGHSHLDHVWYWPEEVGERKMVHLTATALQLLRRYPDFRFMMTSPAMHAALARRSPNTMETVKEHIRAGRWEATGGLWVEPDLNIPCGEALARSLAYSQQYFLQLRGEYSKCVWLPDVFGYTVALPQMMRLAGIEWFSTTKMAWSSVTQFPFDSFVWRSNDGSEVLVHFTSLNHRVENDPARAAAIQRQYRQAEIFPEFLRCEGHGDGGGGPTEAACEREKRIRNLVQVPKNRWGSVEKFFERMEATRGELPVFDGELYLELHQGTFTTQGNFKLAYRQAERGLRLLEAARVATRGTPVDQAPWLRLFTTQFHDALPGTSIGLVYEQMTPQLRDIAQTCEEDARQALAGAGNGTLLFNSLPFRATSVVELPRGEIRATDPGTIQSVATGDGDVCLGIAELDGLAAEEATQCLVAPGGFEAVSPQTLDNGRVRADFDAQGRLASLTCDRLPVALSGPATFRMYHDQPANYDAWDIDQYSWELGSSVGLSLSLSVVEDGPVRACLLGKASIGKASTMTVRYVLEANSPWLRVELTVDWREDHKLLKYHIPTTYHGAYARYGCPFGSILREQKPGGPGAEARWEVPGSRWMTVSDDGEQEGLAVLTEAKYGFSCRDGNVGVSLLKAPKLPDPAADMGTHTIRLALGRNGGDAEPRNPASEAEALFSPFLSVPGGRPIPSPFTIEDGGSLCPAWTCPSETGDGYVIRFHETMGRRGTAHLHIPDSNAAVEYVDFLERPQGAPEKSQDTVYAIAYMPYVIVGVRVRTGH